MKNFFKKIALFVVLDVIIIIAVLLAFSLEMKPVNSLLENSNKFLNIANATNETVNIEIKIDDDLYKYSLLPSYHKILYYKEAEAKAFKITYSVGDEVEKLKYTFDIDDTPSSYYIIIKDKEFIFEKILSLD